LNPGGSRAKSRRVIDENALGVLISYVALEEDEYESDDTGPFVARVTDFRGVCLEALKDAAPAANTHALFIGHALYVEVPEAEQKPKLVSFVRALRERLEERSIATAAVVTFGGRWVEREDVVAVDVVESEHFKWTEVSLPSEPFRKALQVDAAWRDKEAGWEPGLYFDAEVLEPLGLNLKNQPTPLYIGDTTYFRVGR
jgi:hypothetical protein